MSNWDSPNTFWDQPSATWDADPPPSPPNQQQTKLKKMKRQNYFPSRIGDQVNWLKNYADKLPTYAGTLGLDTGDVTDGVADARRAEYALGDWLTDLRDFSPAATSAVDIILYGTGTLVAELPTFTAPTSATGTTALLPGTLNRIFTQAGDIKRAPGFTPAIGIDLGIVGPEDMMSQTMPKMALKVETGTGCQCVRLSFTKYGHQGVYMESRVAGGVWEFLGIDTESPYMDDRPLKVAGTPELREYRMRFWDKGMANGPWTDVGTVTVAP